MDGHDEKALMSLARTLVCDEKAHIAFAREPRRPSARILVAQGGAQVSKARTPVTVDALAAVQPRAQHRLWQRHRQPSRGRDNPGPQLCAHPRRRSMSSYG